MSGTASPWPNLSDLLSSSNEGPAVGLVGAPLAAGSIRGGLGLKSMKQLVIRKIWMPDLT